ncbi:MAG TPA: hypothetical protein VGG77_11005 [Roseiarcus sp.]|jgi:hypothetical protein
MLTSAIARPREAAADSFQRRGDTPKSSVEIGLAAGVKDSRGNCNSVARAAQLPAQAYKKSVSGIYGVAELGCPFIKTIFGFHVHNSSLLSPANGQPITATILSSGVDCLGDHLGGGGAQKFVSAAHNFRS